MNKGTNHFEEFEAPKEFLNLDTKNLFSEIWFKPKLVFLYLSNYNPNKYVQLLLIIAAITSTLDRCISKITIFNVYGIGYFFGGLLGGSLVTYVLYYILAWFLQYFGKAFLNGKASSKDFRRVIAWSRVPAITSILFSILAILIYGINALSDYHETSTEIETYVILIFGILQVILAIWSMIILVIGVKVIQKFSTLKAIGNIFVPIIMLLAVIFIFFYIGRGII